MRFDYQGKKKMDTDIKQLIPQRFPVLMVDELVAADETSATTTLTIRADNYFLDDSGQLDETGLIEHIAQSASAHAGFMAVAAGATTPPIGYIGEVRKFHCHRRPSIGERLMTTVNMGVEVAGITAISAETRVDGEIVADTQMKIFIK